MNVCPICNRPFQPKVPHQQYDRLSCRRKAERQRARMRDKGVDTGDHSLHNPSLVMLQELALVYQYNPNALPTLCTGTIPTWTPPLGIVFQPQADGSGTVMCNEKMLQ